MNPYNRLEVTDRDGWRKDFQLIRPILHLGSDPRNDIVLDNQRGGGVSPRQLQLIAVGSTAVRAINLGDALVSQTGSVARNITPRATADIGDGDCLRVGDFTLVFHLGDAAQGQAALPATPPAESWPPSIAAAPSWTPPAAAALGAQAGRPAAVDAGRNSAGIAVRLSLPRATLVPDMPLEGVIAVRNLGSEPGVQFRIEVLGLESDCYDLGPAPILFPGVEKNIFLRLYHPQRPEPNAGRHTIQVRVTAPEAYPGESVVVSQEIEILPYYRHSLRLVRVE